MFTNSTTTLKTIQTCQIHYPTSSHGAPSEFWSPEELSNLSLLNHSRLVGSWKTDHWLSFEVRSVSLQNAILLNKIKHSLLENLNLRVKRNIVYTDAYQESVTPCRAYMRCLAPHPVWLDRYTPNRDTPLHCPNAIVFPSPGSTPQWWEVSRIFMRVYVGIHANCTHNTHYSVGDGERIVTSLLTATHRHRRIPRSNIGILHS
jgi:hypothetical protein